MTTQKWFGGKFNGADMAQTQQATKRTVERDINGDRLKGEPRRACTLRGRAGQASTPGPRVREGPEAMTERSTRVSDELSAIDAYLDTTESGLGEQVNIMPARTSKPATPKIPPEHYQVCFTKNGGCAPPQGHFRSKAEAEKWASKPCWVVFVPLMPGEKVRWTVKEKKP